MIDKNHKEMTEVKKMVEVLNQLICNRILQGIHHYLPYRTTSSVANSASKNLMEKQCKKQ
jgi:hypothetical protein